MNKEIYEFVFDLRASGFMHHTQMDLETMFHAPNLADIFDRSGNLKSEEADRGVLSPDMLRDMRYFIVGCAFFSSNFLVENGADAEYACGLSDYYINKADKAQTLSDCQTILTEMIQNFLELEQERIKKKEYAIRNRHVRDAIQYIRQHLYSKLTAADTAAFIGKDPSYLNTLFRKETGSGLKHFILLQKIEEAKKILSNTEIEIRQIGEALAFSSSPHFTKAFQNQCGMTPSEYRERTHAGSPV